jgi:hypothetical protein
LLSITSILTIRLIATGFDVAPFDAILPTTTSIIRRQTAEERATELAKTGRVAKAAGMFRYLKNMMYNGEELLLAREISADNERSKLAKKTEKKLNEEEELLEKAEAVYEKHRDGEKLTVPDLKIIVRLVCLIEGKADKKNPSQYTNKKALEARLDSCDWPWFELLAPHLGYELMDSEEEDGADDESASD